MATKYLVVKMLDGEFENLVVVREEAPKIWRILHWVQDEVQGGEYIAEMRRMDRGDD